PRVETFCRAQAGCRGPGRYLQRPERRGRSPARGAGQARGGVFGNGYIGKRTNLLLPDAKVGQVRAKSWGKLCKLRHNLPHDVKLPGFTIGERAKQHAIHNREDGGVRAYAEGKG